MQFLGVPPIYTVDLDDFQSIKRSTQRVCNGYAYLSTQIHLPYPFDADMLLPIKMVCKAVYIEYTESMKKVQ